MTGLDVNNDHILEMACVITDANLNTVVEVTFLLEASCLLHLCAKSFGHFYVLRGLIW